MEEVEYRWCKKCFTKTKQEIIFMPNMPTYKKRRQYKCRVWTDIMVARKKTICRISVLNFLTKN